MKIPNTMRGDAPINIIVNHDVTVILLFVSESKSFWSEDMRTQAIVLSMVNSLNVEFEYNTVREMRFYRTNNEFLWFCLRFLNIAGNALTW